MSFTETDYPRILDAIKVSRTVPLNLNQTATSSDDIARNDWVEMGGILQDPDPNIPLPGNLESDAWWEIFDSSDELKKEFEPVVMSDGTAGMKFSYIPLSPQTEEEAKIVYAKTNLSTIISLNDFIDDFNESAEWIEYCFAGASIYDILLEVVPTGEQSKIMDDMEPPYFEDDPIFMEHDGTRYKVYVYSIQD